MKNLARKLSFALAGACVCTVVILTSSGCATQGHSGTAQAPTTGLTSPTDGTAAATDANSGAKAGDNEHARSPWVYPHRNHMHTFPWHKGQQPSFPAEGK